MSGKNKINFGRIKFMYLYTIIGAGGFFRWPDQDPVVFGITGSVYLAFALASLFGLRSPLKFLPILLLQLFYKSIWFIGVVILLINSGNFPLSAILILVIFATYIIGDLLSIPFSYIFNKEETA